MRVGFFWSEGVLSLLFKSEDVILVCLVRFKKCVCIGCDKERV